MPEEFLTGADGLRFGYYWFGNGPILICHPGGPGAPPEYLEDLGGLSATRTLVIFRSRGTTPVAPDEAKPWFTIDQYAADVETFRQHHGLAQIDLMGHSHGANVAAAYAALHPQRVAHLQLVSLPHAGQIPTDLTRADIDAQLGAITSPTLLISGRNDRVVPDQGQQALTLLRNAQGVLFEECGHDPWEEYPPAFRDLLESHLADLPLVLYPGVSRVTAAPQHSTPEPLGSEGLCA